MTFEFASPLLSDATALTLLPWDAWRPAMCMPAACFGEAIRDTLIRQPANAWSSLAFVVVAGVVGMHGVAAAPAQRPGAVHWLYIVALLWIGLGSAF